MRDRWLKRLLRDPWLKRLLRDRWLTRLLRDRWLKRLLRDCWLKRFLRDRWQSAWDRSDWRRSGEALRQGALRSRGRRVRSLPAEINQSSRFAGLVDNSFGICYRCVSLAPAREFEVKANCFNFEVRSGDATEILSCLSLVLPPEAVEISFFVACGCGWLWLAVVVAVDGCLGTRAGPWRRLDGDISFASGYDGKARSLLDKMFI